MPCAPHGCGTSDEARDPSSVGLHSKSRATPEEPGRRCISRQWSRGSTHDGRSAIAVRNRGAVGGVTKTTRQCRDADTAAPHDGMVSHEAYRTAAWTADVRESARAIARCLEAITG